MPEIRPAEAADGGAEGFEVTPEEEAELLEAVREAARPRALARLRTGYDLQWTPPRSRDELHER